MPFLAAPALAILLFFGATADWNYAFHPEEGPTVGDAASIFFPTPTGPKYVKTISDGCAQWASNILTSSGSGCGTGSGSSGISSSTPWTAGYLAYVVNNSTVRGVATSSLTINTPLTTSGTAGSLVGGTNLTIDIDDIKASDLDLTDITLSDFTNDAGFTTFAYPFPAGATTTPLSFGRITATYASTTGISSPYASSTNLVAGNFTFGGVTGNSWDDFCTAITGDAGLCDGDDATGAGGGITTLGPAGQGQTGSTQTFATSSDTNIGLTITSSGNTHTFTSNWIGTLADARVSDTLTIGASGSVADGALSANVSLLGSTIGATELASADFGDWTCNGTICTIDADAVTLGTDTTGNYTATISSTGSISVGNGSAEGGAATVNLNTAWANDWTGLQNFTNASTSLASAGWLRVGRTASTTIDAAGNIALPAAGTLTIPNLTSALLLTDGNGLLAEYGGSSGVCTNQVPMSISVVGALGTCTSINNSWWSGTDLSVANGGTGLSTFGGTNTILYTSAADTLTSDAAFLFNGSIDTMTVPHASTTNLTASQSFYVGTNRVQGYETKTFTYGSTTQGVGTSTTFGSFTFPAAATVVSTQCYFNNFMRVLFQDTDGNRLNDLVASSTTGTFTFSSNNTFTAAETIQFYTGTTTSSLGTISGNCTLLFRYTN